MRDLDIITNPPRGRSNWQKVLAGSFAAAILLGSVAPSLAGPGGHRHEARAGFQHHFYRGQQLHAVNRARNVGRGAAHFGYGAAALGVGILGSTLGTAVDAAMDADVEPWDEAVAYCADRFKSYDPLTGTYLGYDGLEHACP